MKGIGIILLVAGLIGAVFALSMDTSVNTGYGSVNNIGLMAEKQNLLLFAGFAATVGAILFGFSSVQQGDKTALTTKTHSAPPNKVMAAILNNDIEALRSAILAGDDILTTSEPLEYAQILERSELVALLWSHHAASLKAAE